MFLAPNDVALFFKLHRSLMFFVNERLKVISDEAANPKAYSSLPPEARFKVHEALFKHMELIQAFVDGNPFGLPTDELDIVLSWKHLVHGTFYAMRETKDYMVFLSSQTPAVAYGVLPLSQPFEELIGPYLPVMLQTTLLPFKDRIVYDGVLSTFNVVLGPGICRNLKEELKAAQSRHGIVTSLPISQAAAQEATKRPHSVRRGRRKTTTAQLAIEQTYPAVADFVRNRGHIEIGYQDGMGFVARALDYGGLVFESARVKSLAGAMSALEKALAKLADDD